MPGKRNRETLLINFTNKGRKKHGDKFNYSLVNYTGEMDPVTIICPIHGEFLIKPRLHLIGNFGCRNCFIESQRGSLSEFLEKANKVHNGKFDYSLTNYVDQDTEIIIICPIHDKIIMKPNAHLGKFGCFYCFHDSLKHTTLSFVTSSAKIHGDKYLYGKVNYIDNTKEVVITCKIHGDFEQTPHSHLCGNGCNECGKESMSKLLKGRISKLRYTTEKFIEISNLEHGGEYTYKNSVYRTNDDDIIVTCKEHGDFAINAHAHMHGQKCQICSIKNRIYNSGKGQSRIGNYHGNGGILKYKKIEDFVEIANKTFDYRFDYSLVFLNNDSIRVGENIDIICPIHNIFSTTPTRHLRSKHGSCRKCATDSNKMKIEDFLEKSNKRHGDLYDYTQIQFIASKEKVKNIICKIHGGFDQIGSNHILGQGCPDCMNSHGVSRVSMVLEKLGQKYKREKLFDECKNIKKLPFDFFLYELNICIEFDGKLHYKPWDNSEFSIKELEKVKYRDSIKTLFCDGIDGRPILLRIPYWEYDNIEKIITEYLLEHKMITL